MSVLRMQAHLQHAGPALADATLCLDKRDRFAVLEIHDRPAQDGRALDVIERPPKSHKHVVVERCVRRVVPAPVQHDLSEQAQVGRPGPHVEERVLHAEDTRGEAVSVPAACHGLELPQRGSPRVLGVHAELVDDRVIRL